MPDTPNTNTKNTEPSNLDKLDGQSMDITAQRLAAIKEVLPEAFDLDGNLVRDKLLEALKPASYKASDDIPSFGLAWPGKQSAFAAAGVPTTATLRPCPNESVDFDTTKNLLIEGDNLEVLKTLQRSYHGKVKMIYIDPPYNTGKDFVYPDNYGEGLDTYLERTQQKDEDGFWSSTNSETSGRKHANWLSMMAPRLTLARNLLRDDGLIFISIDDNEVANLRMLCNEVFGVENFIGQFTWKARVKPVNIGEAKYRPQKEVDYVLAYQKTNASNKFFPLMTGGVRTYSHTLGDRKYRLTTILKSNRGSNQRSTMRFELNGYTPPDGQRWQAGEDVIKTLWDTGYIEFVDGTPQRRYFEDEEGAEHDPFYCFMEVDWSSTSETGKNTLNDILGDRHGFDTVKPVQLLRTFAMSCTKEDDIILDFFAGSGTTGHAAMALNGNGEDGGNRRYICVQLPEPLDEPVTLDGGVICETIFDLTRERLKRAGKKIKDEAGLNAEKLDTGLRVFKLDSSNFTAWNGDPTTSEADLLERLEQLNDQTVAGRSETDILWEMLLKMGLPLDLQLEHFELEGASFIGVADRTKVISTQESIPVSALEALLDQDIPPSELVVLDSAFKDDSARANIATLYKERKDDDGQPVCKLKVV